MSEYHESELGDDAPVRSNAYVPTAREDMAYMDIEANRPLQLLGTPAQIAEMFEALALADAGFAHIEKNRTVTIKGEKGSYTFNYAELSESIGATRPALSQNGLTLRQPFSMLEVGKATLFSILTHKNGACMIATCVLPEARDMKTLGGHLTYVRRYAYNAMLCLAADEDLDDQPEAARGETSAESRPRREPPKRTPEVPVQGA